jgi:hypothetical protein
MHGKVPSEWSTAAIVPFPKKGDLTKPANYRGILLTSVAAKIYNKLLMNRIYPFIDPLLRHNQNGFRRGRSTLPHILSIIILVEECQIGNKTAAMVFVDFSKDFDSINREAMPMSLCSTSSTCTASLCTSSRHQTDVPQLQLEGQDC